MADSAQASAAQEKLPAAPIAGGWVSVSVAAVGHGLVAAVYAFPLAGLIAGCAAGVAALVAALIGVWCGRGRTRGWLFALLIPLAFILVGVVQHAIAGSDAVVSWLGPGSALRLSEAAQLASGAAVFAFVLRVWSTRQRWFLLLETFYAAGAFVLLVVAHRHGAIHRPFALADPLLERGLDPTIGLLLVGALAAVAVVLLVLRERHPGRYLLHAAAVALLLAALLAVAATTGVMSPPIDDDALGMLGDGDEQNDQNQGGGGGSGRDSELEFRDDYNSEQQKFPVGVVLFHDDYTPPNGIYYFRQGAFSQYNGRRLVAATQRDVNLDIANAFPLAPTRLQTHEPPGWARKKVETTVALLADHIRPIGLEAPLELRPSQNPDPRRFRRLYRVWSAATDLDYALLLGAPVGDPDWSEEVSAHYREAPEDPRYQTLARRIVDEVLPEVLREDPVAQAYAIQSWLSQNGTYSLKSRHASASDPTADFLFGDLVGYCVHFSHASTFLMRALGLPSRVATGYAVDESARQGGSAVLISGQTSHAWPELYVDGIGWLIVDVSPAQALSGAPAPPDPELQRLLAELARGERPLPFDGPEPPKLEELGEGTLALLGWGFGGGAAVILFLLYAIKLWRAWVPRFAGPSADARLHYRAALDRLGELAQRRKRGESPEAFMRRTAAIAPAFDALTLAHLRAAFSPRAGSPSSQRGASRPHFLVLRQELRQAFPWWKRILGLVTPWSWLFSR